VPSYFGQFIKLDDSFYQAVAFLTPTALAPGEKVKNIIKTRKIAMLVRGTTITSLLIHVILPRVGGR
jgi:hypothetical protein